ncbi:MAG: NTP transferase domain-containing protein [Candidatus Kerfeldbacteria bacterium]|nr:NTP transferase domain-containing protein [Candidatus Kerfeldbacteria bacterium]
MKGIILAGGHGTRLRPMTLVTSKQLLPVYDRPMIFFPINTLIQAGIKDILIIVAPDRAGDFLRVLGSGKNWGVKFTYEIQDKPSGLPEAFIIGSDFIDQDSVTMILGDNIVLGREEEVRRAITTFTRGNRVFATKVSDPGRFGVIEFDKNHQVKSIEEKPLRPKSDYIIMGLYIFDNQVVQIAKSLIPSARGELEITDILKVYLSRQELDVKLFSGEWFDTGTPDSLLRASNYVADHQRDQNT